MTPGTLCVDNNFQYRDGKTGKKILVVLNDGSIGYYLTVKTTSKDTYKGINYGCQTSDRYPNFFLPRGSCCLHLDTWVMLDDFFEFRSHDVLARHFSGQMNRIGILPEEITKELLNCSINCYDITIAQTAALKEILKAMSP